MPPIQQLQFLSKDKFKTPPNFLKDFVPQIQRRAEMVGLGGRDFEDSTVEDLFGLSSEGGGRRPPKLMAPEGAILLVVCLEDEIGKGEDGVFVTPGLEGDKPDFYL